MVTRIRVIRMICALATSLTPGNLLDLQALQCLWCVQFVFCYGLAKQANWPTGLKGSHGTEDLHRKTLSTWATSKIQQAFYAFSKWICQQFRSVSHLKKTWHAVGFTSLFHVKIFVFHLLSLGTTKSDAKFAEETQCNSRPSSCAFSALSALASTCCTSSGLRKMMRNIQKWHSPDIHSSSARTLATLSADIHKYTFNSFNMSKLRSFLYRMNHGSISASLVPSHVLQW